MLLAALVIKPMAPNVGPCCLDIFGLVFCKDMYNITKQHGQAVVLPMC